MTNEKQLRIKFRNDVKQNPNVLLNQYVAYKSTGPSWKVTEVREITLPSGSRLCVCHLDGRKFDGPSNYTEETGYVYTEGWTLVDALNYFAADLIALYQGHIDNLLKRVSD